LPLGISPFAGDVSEKTPGAGTAELSRRFADMPGGKVRVIQNHRPVNQADDNLSSALSTFHQSGEPDQIQRIRGASREGLS
jgi:hypothetical protein